MANTADKVDHLPWVEKYRPKDVSDLISHEEIIKIINRFIDQGQFPHLIFYGPPGTGKTSMMLAFAHKLYKSGQFNSMVLELNASDDRGIGIVRGQILNFASTGTMYKSGFKLIILDEADAMTLDAQNALRRIMEKYSENVRFCIICNYLGKIIPALQSRCTKFRFASLGPEQILQRLEYIIKEENLQVTEDGKQALLMLSGGDMRCVLNVLQSTSLLYGSITEENVYSCVGHPLPTDVNNIANWLFNETFQTCYDKIQDLKIKKGLALQSILTGLHLFVNKIDLPTDVIMHLLLKLADIEKRMSIGCNETLQLSSLVSAFQVARDLKT